MSKLSRVTQKIFGLNAGTNQIAQFGSLANSTPTFTTSPSTIQALANYLTGWFGAVIGSNSPAIEDMNALFFLITYQLAEIFQAGIAEWDAGTTYYTNSLVNFNGVVYISLADTNLNNTPPNGTYWGQPVQNGVQTPNSVPASLTVTTGNTMMWPNMIIPTGETFTVATGANYVGVSTLVLQGTATLVLQGTAVAKII